jgi:putative DNA primase/helicase
VSDTKRPFHEQVAERLIAQLKEGTAPWQKPWVPGESSTQLPYNPVSGTRYRGANALWLAAAGRADPRWMTYRQAQQQGWQVRKGEKGEAVQYWKFEERALARDESGAPLLDERGQPREVTVALERPRVFHAVVFNAQQIEGVPPLPVRDYAWDPIARAEALLAASGATLRHQGGDRACYLPAADAIVLPLREQFGSADRYYATALHELGHWTGHPRRLDRDLSHPFGSEGYAKEELRAEIASLLLGDTLGIGHDPGQHAAYVGSWIKALEEDPREIVRAARDAEHIMTYLLGLEREQQLAVDPRVAPEVGTGRETAMSTPKIGTERTTLAVPYRERGAAKAAGARWDAQERSWYAPAGTDLARLERWLPEPQGPALDAREELAAALHAAGLQLEGLPVMDGALHRVAVADGPPGNKDGAYTGHLDGRPAGFIQNFREGIKTTWVSSAVRLSDEERASLRAEAVHKKAQREVALHQRYLEVAEALVGKLARLAPCTGEEPYLQRKGLDAIPGVLTDAAGTLYVPARDRERVWSVQRIEGDGFKGFEKDARKAGTYFVIGEGRLPQSEAILIAEGVATGASLHQATGRPVVVAFDAGNLQSVANELRETHPEKAIIVMGDDDRHKALNRGRRDAEQAAAAVGGEALFPQFTASEVGADYKDWNDLHRSRGIETVRRQVEQGVERTRQRRELALAREREAAGPLRAREEPQRKDKEASLGR